MPTLPEPHQERGMAESFGADAARYDRTRPPYPPALIERIVAGSPGREVLDVGCGTGIEARQLINAGCSVLGVEPDARMAAFARDTGLDVEVSTFEAWEPAGRSFDAVVAATAWHWVDPVLGAAKAATVLRPAGRLAVFWHTFDLPAEVTDALATVFEQELTQPPVQLRVLGSEVQAYQALFDKAADGIRHAGAFSEPEQWRFDWSRTYTRDEWLDQLPTSGALTRLEPSQLERVLSGTGAAIDAIGGAFTLAYATVAVTAVRNAH